MKNLLLIIASLAVLQLNAQDSFAPILQSIEENNSTLRALREQTNAMKIENHTGINMANPEVEYGKQWGNKNAESDKYDVSIKQSFDFPTAYRHKKQLARQMDKHADLQYSKQKRDILTEARSLCLQLVYQEELNRVLTERVAYARELSDGYEKLFEKGDIDVIERNRTRLSRLNMEKSKEMNEVSINTLRQELQRLNGGIPMDGFVASYPKYSLPADFDMWFDQIKVNNPTLSIATQEVDNSRKLEELKRSLNLPKFSAGYVNSYEGGGRFNGFTVGVSIPLWAGKNTVKAQKAQTQALLYQSDDCELQFRNVTYNQYDKAKRLLGILTEYKETLDNSNDRQLLQKAFEKGQLSLISFLQELSAYYATEDLYLQAQCDYQMTVLQLQQWEN